MSETNERISDADTCKFRPLMNFNETKWIGVGHGSDLGAVAIRSHVKFILNPNLPNPVGVLHPLPLALFLKTKSPFNFYIKRQHTKHKGTHIYVIHIQLSLPIQCTLQCTFCRLLHIQSTIGGVIWYISLQRSKVQDAGNTAVSLLATFWYLLITS